MQPMRPVFRDDGSFAGRSQGLRYSNPVALANLNTTELETMRAFGNIEANFQAFNSLRLTGRGGFDALGLDETQWESPLVDRTYAASANGVGKSGHTGASKYLLEGYATLEPFNTATSRLSIVGGASVEYNESTLNFIRGEGFTSGFRRFVRNASNVTEYDGSQTSNNLVGFRFQNEANGNATHYGWMRISLSSTLQGQPRAIVEYAYESEAGVSIPAGAIPTPGSAALLALGAAGLAGRRRR